MIKPSKTVGSYLFSMPTVTSPIMTQSERPN